MEPLPTHDEREVPLGVLFKFIHQAAEHKFNQYLQELNLTASQMHILIYLERCEAEEKTVNQRDIERHLHLSNPTVTGLLQRLEAKGFITRTVSETDGRNKQIKQTDACRMMHAEMHHRMDLRDQKMIEGLTEEDIVTLRRYLNIVLNNMQK